MTTTEKPTISPQDPTHSSPHGSLDNMTDEEREIIEHYQNMFETVSTDIGDDLKKYYEAGDEAKFASALEDVVYDLMDKDQYYVQLLAEVKEARAHKQTHDEQTAAINALDANYRKLVLSISGLPDPETLNELQIANQNVAKLLADKLGADTSDTSKVQEALGIRIQSDSSDEARYRFPYEVMPECVIKQWHTYLASVGDFDRATKALLGSGDKNLRDAVEEVDKRRKRIHDQLAKDFLTVVGLDEKDGWDFDSTRQLIATIRDNEFSHYKTLGKTPDEAALAAYQESKMNQIVDANGDSLAVLEKLSKKKQ